MLKFGNLIPTPEGDFSYTLDISIIRPTLPGLEFKEKSVTIRTQDLDIAIHEALVEFTWHIRGEAESYVSKCNQVWDELTAGQAPVMVKPQIRESFDLLNRFIKYLYTDEGFYIQPTCTYFGRMQQHFLYVLPPADHPWHKTLYSVLEDLTSLRDAVQKHIDNVEPLLKIQENPAA